MKVTAGKSPSEKWEEMFAQLCAFKQRHGDCNVPANFPDNPKLGRWVSAQRFKNRVGELLDRRKEKLESVGFPWSPSDASWERHFQLLKKFKEKEGHCDVPRYWDGDKGLANWVQSQRHRRKRGKLATDRIERLDRLGFTWHIYRTGGRRHAERKAATSPSRRASRVTERLYALGHDRFVQYNGRGRKPKALEQYIEKHKGNYPPYIPLPQRETVFLLGKHHIREKSVHWKGRGRLSRDVLTYVKENGTLPPHE